MHTCGDISISKILYHYHDMENYITIIDISIILHITSPNKAFSYHIVGKFGRERFGKFGESSMIRQTKTIQISTYNYNLLAEAIHSPNFFAKCSK